MSPYLTKELYQQIKQVISRPIALADAHGAIVRSASDFRKIKKVTLRQMPTREHSCIAVVDQPTLQAIPLYHEDKLLLLVVTEVTPEDIQTIQLVTSLGELIIQQFMLSHRPRPDAVDLLLNRVIYRPASIDAEELEQQVAALGYRLDLPRSTLVFELHGFWQNYLQTIGQPLAAKRDLIASKKHDIERAVGGFFSRNQDNIVGYIGKDRFVVLKDLANTDYEHFCELLQKNYKAITDSLKNVHVQEVSLGIGSLASSSGDLISSSEEALRALEIGQKLFGGNRAYRSDRLGILPLLLSTNVVQKNEYAGNLLRPLKQEIELTDTLTAFLAHNLNLTQTAEVLKIHRNTVIYRLDKITELTQKDPRVFEDAIELYVAWQLVKIAN